MKAGIFVIAAAIAAGVSAGNNHAARRHAHVAFHEQRDAAVKEQRDAVVHEERDALPKTCDCTTIYTTITGEGTLYSPPPPATPAPPPPAKTTAAPVVTSSPPALVPTPLATTCPTPGVYTIPAATVTLTEYTTVCAATSTSVPAGTHTVGGVVTVVETATTVVCPYATTSSSAGVVVSTILTTTYVCPSAGTYTIAPLTTTVEVETIWVYPTPASYAPGVYTQAEVVTTITETDVVIFCPYTTPAPAAAAPTSAPAAVAAPAAAPVEAAPAGPAIGGSGNKWAVTYSPYEDNGNCKDMSSVSTDIALIASKGFGTVRIYSTDCSSLENVGAACQASGLKMILGVFVSNTGLEAASPQIAAIASWAQWSMVELIVVGNEAVFNGFCSPEEMASFISSAKSTLAAAGYTGPCTTTEPLNIWQANSGTLCEVVDVVGCNVHPFFNSDVDAASAGSFTAGQMELVDGLCPGKSGVNLETGWPSAGECNGDACPGPSEQATAVAGIISAVGSKSVMFSFTNDMWKSPGAFDCEQSWGVIELF